MKKILLIIFISLIFNLNLFSQIWTEQVSGVTTQLTSVSVIDYNNAWICGYSGVVLRTTNAGINWLNVSTGIPNTVSLINVFGVSDQVALVAGYTGSNTWVWRTSNAGANWTQVFTQAGFINAVWMSSASNGIMEGDPVGGRWTLFKTTNGGVSWDSSGMYLPQAATETGFNNSFLWLPPRIWFGTNNSRIYYSSNNGLTWSAKSTGTEINSYAIFFYSNGNPSGVAGGATLLQSNDTGYTWSAFTSLGTGNFGGFTGYFIPVENNMWIQQLKYVRSSNIVYSAFSPGGWIAEYTAPAGTYRHISMNRQNWGGIGMTYAVRNNGGITRCTCPVSGLTRTSEEVPDNFVLNQNFPNPFNPATNIPFELPYRSVLKIAIYNSAGQLIEELYNGNLGEGKYNITWDGSKYSSGIYFYTMIVTKSALINQKYVETKKMVMIK